MSENERNTPRPGPSGQNISASQPETVAPDPAPENQDSPSEGTETKSEPEVSNDRHEVAEGVAGRVSTEEERQERIKAAAEADGPLDAFK